MSVKACQTCGKRFEAHDDELVYCSEECFRNRNKSGGAGRAKVVKCPVCGEPFVQWPPQKRMCSPECVKELRRRRRRNMTSKEWPIENESKANAERRRSYLARRDAEYAANAAPVTSVERGGVRIETRGNRVWGGLSGVHRQLVTDYGVVYVA